jgi:hypothetical protein
VTVPLRLDNLGGKEVTSYQFEIAYDPGVIMPLQLAADIDGTLSQGLSVLSNSPEPGLLKVVVYGAVPASGDGVYVKLRFMVIGESRGSTDLKIRAFRFNDGKDNVTAAGGRIVVVD